MSYFIIAFINATAFMSTRHITNPTQLGSMLPVMMANPAINSLFKIAKVAHAVLYVIILIYGINLMGWYIALPFSLLVFPILGSFISFKLDPGLTSTIFSVLSMPAYISLLFIW